MPFRLVRIDSTGNIITGDALKGILQDEGFVLPEVPPLLQITVPQPKREDYDSPGAHIMACAEWTRLYARPAQVRIQLRDTICRQFARDLEDAFHIARITARRQTLALPGVDGAPKHLTFAKRLLSVECNTNITDPVEWICFAGV